MSKQTTDEDYARQLQLQYDEEYQKEIEAAREATKFPDGIGDAVVKFLDDLWNNKNFKVVDDSFAEDCVSKGPWGNTVGRNEFKTKVILPLFNAFPDLKYVSHEVFQEGRRIVNRWTFTGTHTGTEYGGIPPDGCKMTYSGVTINRFGEDGTIAEIYTFYDRQALFEQLQIKK